MIKEFFGFFDIVSALFVLMLILVHAGWRRGQFMEVDHYRYFMPSLLFKLLLGLTFALFYVIAYNGGGDTVAYWSGAVRLSNLFYESPGEYFEALFASSEIPLDTLGFSKSTGLPPSWIYYEKESWLVCKFISFIPILTFKSFLAGTVMFVYAAHYASWKLYELVLKMGVFPARIAALAILFIPSVNFWCSGASKDTVLYIGMMLFTTYIFIFLEKPGNLTNLFKMLLVSVLLANIRSIMFVAVVLPILFVISRKILNNQNINFLYRLLIRLATYAIVIFITGFILTNGSYFQSDSINEYLAQAEEVKEDFTNNANYGENRYFLEVQDFSVFGILRSIPQSVVAGLYRPFLWEALTPSLILNGLESVILLYLTARFFFKANIKDRLRAIVQNEFMIFMLISVLFIAFFSGFSSVLFGVLVRLRSFALPFFVLLLLYEKKKPEAGTDDEFSEPQTLNNI